MIYPITKIWKTEEGTHFFLATKDRDAGFTQHAFTRAEFKVVVDWIDAHRSVDVYWCIGGFNGPHRLEEYAAPSQWLWADLDTADPRDLRERPTIVWQSSPGHYHALWKCDRAVPKGLRKGFNDHIGGDKGGWIITKLLRIPNGVKNYKYDPPARVKLIDDAGPTYRVGDLMRYAVIVAAVELGSGGRPVGDASAILRKYRIDRTLLTACQPPRDGRPGYRSSVVHRLAMLLVEGGASRAETGAAVFASASFRSKWGSDVTRLWKEIDAAFAKKKR
jgi:hypothetical protein